ncbi:DUF4231 domain-containing protein [Candidatus Poribacteria bacterium]|nr:DUF4231 domain-containing protein [Candidatus Poribacteria bacterium]MYC40134.1 DUF4231 domain-containing protein [Candidatus Dadabacteria bacterium]
MTPEEYLKDRVEQQINWYDCKSTLNKRYFYLLQIIVLVMSAAVPVVSILSIVFESIWIRLAIGILGALATIATGIISICQFRKNWIEYRTTAESLKCEKYMFRTKTGFYAKSGTFPVFVERIEALISKEHKNWEQHLRIQKQAD